MDRGVDTQTSWVFPGVPVGRAEATTQGVWAGEVHPPWGPVCLYLRAAASVLWGWCPPGAIKEQGETGTTALDMSPPGPQGEWVGSPAPALVLLYHHGLV